MKNVKVTSKFESLTREELLRQCIELEDENAKLRPEPAKFKLGQVLALQGKHPFYPGQPCLHFSALSVENRHGEWFYGYQKRSQGFDVFSEKKLRALTPTEMDGTKPSGEEAPAPVVATEASSAPVQGQAFTLAYNIPAHQPNAAQQGHPGNNWPWDNVPAPVVEADGDF